MQFSVAPSRVYSQQRSKILAFTAKIVLAANIFTLVVELRCYNNNKREKCKEVNLN